MVHILLHFNRTFADAYSPIFEVCTAIEMTFIIFFLLLAPITFATLISARPLHRNYLVMWEIFSSISRIAIYVLVLIWKIRILLSHFVVQGVVGMSSRLFVMYQQYFGTELHDQSNLIIFSSISRIAMYSFFCGSMLAFSTERIIATYFWKWYEKTPPASIVIIVVTEGTSIVHSWFWASAFVYEYISIAQLLIVFVCHFGIGALLFAGIFSYNKREKLHLEAGAQINRYSIAFTYQIRENLVALRAILGLSKRIAVLNIPLLSMAFVVFIVLPKSDGNADTNSSYVLFDIMISIYPLVIAGYVPFSDPIFERSMLRLTYGKGTFSILSFFFRKNSPDKKSTATIHETDIYFKMLNNSIR